MPIGSIGLDFGTTNSSIALLRADGIVQLAQFPYRGSVTESFRSLLYLERLREGHRNTIKSWSGPQGIERYLQTEEKGRLIQSLKSFLSSRSLQTTEIFGRSFKLEQLVANILRDQEILEAARRDAMNFVSHPPSEEELRRAVAYIRDHWQRQYGLVTVG